MIFLQKVWGFLRHYWYVPVGLTIALVLLLVTRDKKHIVDWKKTLNDASASHKAEVKAIDDAHVAQKAADDRDTRRALEAQRQIIEEYARNQRELDAKQQKLIQQITKKLKNDPQAMALALERETGYKVIILE